MNSSVMSNPRLWNAYTNVRCIGWVELLEEWHDTLQIPSQVQTFLDNLGAASSPNSMYKPSYTQLTNFLNNEQVALKWFLYEAIARGWLWGEVRVDFVQRLVDHIDNLDSCFPQFPGSPWTQTTIRAWVSENLTDSELLQVDIMPPLMHESYVSHPSHPSYASPHSPVTIHADEYNYLAGYSTPLRAPRPLTAPALIRKTRPKTHSKIEFRIMRDMDSAGKDDRMTIENNGDSYTLCYMDSDSSLKFRTEGLSRENLIHTLRMTLRLLSIDEEPFEFLQVLIPSMPSIMVKPENLTSQTRDLIYDSVEATMDNWPFTV